MKCPPISSPPAVPMHVAPVMKGSPESAAAERPPGTHRARGARAALDSKDQEAYDRLSTMVAVVGVDATCLLVNSALENTVRQSRRKLVHAQVLDWFADPAPLQGALKNVTDQYLIVSRFDATLRCQPPGTHELPVHVIVSPVGRGGSDAVVVVEMIEIERQVHLDREERMHSLVQAHQELLRNLAHEVKNPLGGIRGAAQLLGLESASRGVTDYTDVIVREADRLQALVDRLLAPRAGAPVWTDVNIHEICERARSLVLAEFPSGLDLQRDYDTSLPELRGDRERLIQALLNIVRNAAQALTGRIPAGDARIVLRTRIARQATLGGQRFRLAIELQVADNGPGVPEALREHIFQPLVSGRPGGQGLGLTLAQDLVQQHGGTLECESGPGATRFTLLLPLREAGALAKRPGAP